MDPEQVFGGVFFQSGDIFGGLRVRPGVDGGTGDGLRIATINLDLVYGFPLGANGWTLIQGGGPSIVITRLPTSTSGTPSVGFHSIFGFGHDSGFFTEVRLGSGVAQSLSVARRLGHHAELTLVGARDSGLEARHSARRTLRAWPSARGRSPGTIR